jgi:bifunctional enzyme CysN/CysC
MAALFADAGVIVITAFISPYKNERHAARAAFPDNFHSVYINADIDTCEERDVKGLYKKARAGEIEEFTGISAPFEEPDNSDLEINTSNLSIEDSIEKLADYLDDNFVKPVYNQGSKLSEFSGSSI